MDSPGLLISDPNWAADALQRVISLGEDLARTVCIARVLSDNGRAVDMAGLDRGIGLVCAKALDLPQDQGHHMVPHLAALLGEIEQLTASLGRSCNS